METAYSYIRFSSAKQQKGDSLRRQTEHRQEFCRRHKLTLDDSLRLRDLGVSAYRGANEKAGALGVFLLAVKEGRVKAGSWLLIENLDRLSRQEPLTSLGLVKRLIDAGITVASISENLVLSVATIAKEPGLLYQMLGSLIRAHEESKRKSEMVRSSKENRRRMIVAGDLKAAKGLRPSWIDRENNAFRLNPEKAATVRRIVGMAIDGAGFAIIVKTLNSEKVTRLVATMDTLPEMERELLRSQLRAAIARVVTKIRLYVYGKHNAARVAYAQVQLADGQDRLFSIVTRKGKPPEGRSDNTLGLAHMDYSRFFDQWAEDELNGTARA